MKEYKNQLYFSSSSCQSSFGFSLVEVVTAMGIAAFAIVAVVGLFAVGLRSNSESSDTLGAANLASLIICQRRAAPTAQIEQDGRKFGLPPLNQNFDLKKNPEDNLFIGLDGYMKSSTDGPGGIYRLVYSITPPDLNKDSIPDRSGVADVYLMLLWPATASPDKASGKYEIATKIYVP